MRTKNVRWWFEDFPEGSVREFWGVTLSKEEILEFARKYDPQPFHVDEEEATRSTFAGLAASGWQTCAIAMRMACDEFLLDAAVAGSPGVESIRWLKPVRANDTLRVRLRTVEARVLRSKPHLGVLKQAWQVLNQDGAIVMTMKSDGLMHRRSAVSRGAPSAPRGSCA